MKKLVIALSAVAAFSAPAFSADMAAKAPMRAAAVAYAPSWTGCYISGGGGYGLYRVNRDERIPAAGVDIPNSTAGGDGWLATAGAGCDYQFNNRWVVGVLGDGTWSDIKGDPMIRVFGVNDASVGELKTDWSWAVGGRVGYLVNPSFLTYVNAGYTQARFNAHNLNSVLTPSVFTGIQIPGQTFDGLFVGTGVEYAFDWLPGLFIRSEGRAAWYNRKDVLPTCVAAGSICAGPGTPGVILLGFLDTDSRRPIIYTAKTELVYRFNWGGPAVAKY